MPRLARLVPLSSWTPGGPLFLVAQRGLKGTDQASPWPDQQDEQAYLECFFEAATGQGLRVHAWSIADREALWLVRPLRPRALAETLQQVGRRYVRQLNARWGRSGSPWEGRYRASWVDESLSLQVTHWIDRCRPRGSRGLALTGMQPADAVRVPPATAWLLAGWVGTARLPAWRPPTGYWALGNTPFEREKAYEALLETPPDEALVEDIRRGLAQGLPILTDELWGRLPEEWRAFRARRPVGRPRRVQPVGPDEAA